MPSAEGIQSADLITNKRSIKTTILADDAQTIVLGGLIQDDVKRTVSKVPLLGDIPLLGHLFRATSNAKTKRNLLVFVTARLVDPAGRAVRTGGESALMSGGAAGQAAQPPVAATAKASAPAEKTEAAAN